MGYAIAIMKSKRFIGKIKCGNFHKAKEVGVTLLVNVDGGKDLAAITVFDLHKKSMLEFAEYLNAKVSKQKKSEDTEHKKATATSKIVPTTLLAPLLVICGWLSFCIGISIKALGLNPRMAGHAIITNVGPLKVQEGIAPFTPFMHAQLMICCGAIQKKPVVDENGEIKAGQVCVINCNMDHRYGDAAAFS